jgi:DNA-directed RNA polymerase specialized sigma24 family protein
VRHDDSAHGGRERHPVRVDLARKLPDTCAVDLAERAASARLRQGVACMTLTEIATVLGTDHGSISRSLSRALRKVKLRVIVDGR